MKEWSSIHNPSTRTTRFPCRPSSWRPRAQLGTWEWGHPVYSRQCHQNYASVSQTSLPGISPYQSSKHIINSRTKLDDKRMNEIPTNWWKDCSGTFVSTISRSAHSGSTIDNYRLIFFSHWFEDKELLCLFWSVLFCSVINLTTTLHI